MKKVVLVVIIALAVLGLGVYLAIQDSKPVEKNDFSFVPSSSQLLSNLNNAGLAALSTEGTELHIHQHIDIVINGDPVTIPAEVGIGAGFISPLHTHDTTGILHVESPEIKDFKLGQFFTEWGIRFDNNCIATYCSDDTHKLIAAVNGNPIENPADHVLAAHEEIYIWYGLKSVNPDIPKSFDFPPGL